MKIFEDFEGSRALRLLVMGIGVTACVGAQNWTGGSNGAIYYNGGNVGIGTPNPPSTLTVQTAPNPPQWINALQIENPSSSGATYIGFTHNGGLTSTIRSDFGGSLILSPFMSGSLWYGADNSGTQNHLFYTTGAQRMVINAAGNVGIGTTNPQHLLQVAGTIGAEEVLVTSTGADYVFEPGYRLKPLDEVANYIDANHHLPDIPSAEEVTRKGMGVGEMEAKLLAKIEELTLHMIQEHDRNGALERQNHDLQERIERLEIRDGSLDGR